MKPTIENIQQLNLEQRLSLTPQMLQSIRILQMNAEELSEEIREELLSNPLLEQDDTRPDRDRENLQDGGGLSGGDLMDGGVGDSPEDDYSDGNRDDGDPANFSASSGRTAARSTSGEPASLDEFIGASWSLYDDLAGQLAVSGAGPKLERICLALIDTLDPDGYFTMPKSELGAALSLSPYELTAGLNVIRHMDPPGVGAFDLFDCLRLQAEADGLLTGTLRKLFDKTTPETFPDSPAALAKMLNVSQKAAEEAFAVLRGFDPWPGRVYQTDEPVEYLIPDVILRYEHGEPALSINEALLPPLKLNDYYVSLVEKAQEELDVSEYLANRLKSAQQLLENIRRRNRTLLRIAGFIARRQDDFFRNGERYLQPLTLADAATALELHESTVSRAIRGKYMQSPRGTFEFHAFFSRPAGTGGEISVSGIRYQIRKLIEEENPAHPLSDQKIADLLLARSIPVPRRTVAKYRSMLGFGSASERRRR